MKVDCKTPLCFVPADCYKIAASFQTKEEHLVHDSAKRFLLVYSLGNATQPHIHRGTICLICLNVHLTIAVIS